MARSIKAYLYTWVLTTMWTNIVCATLESITKKKNLSLVNSSAIGQDQILLKHSGVKSRGPVHCVFVQIKRVLADKIFKGFLSKNNEAVIVRVIILV